MKTKISIRTILIALIVIGTIISILLLKPYEYFKPETIEKVEYVVDDIKNDSLQYVITKMSYDIKTQSTNIDSLQKILNDIRLKYNSQTKIIEEQNNEKSIEFMDSVLVVRDCGFGDDQLITRLTSKQVKSINCLAINMNKIEIELMIVNELVEIQSEQICDLEEIYRMESLKTSDIKIKYGSLVNTHNTLAEKYNDLVDLYEFDVDRLKKHRNIAGGAAILLFIVLIAI